MTLNPGTRLGPYEIQVAIGAGGMGEVYRATDTGLKRQVAIKVLPDAVAADPERLARFQREAEVLASLNHPHIAQIYGLEEGALVMELVEGPTLADRIAQGALPLDEALAIARQIAEALEAAHEQGIVHRDLKPANIKVRPDGTVKVLDFGLAKLTGPAEAGHYGRTERQPDGRSVRLQPDLSLSPTITSPVMATGVGTLLGTATYMSPEQARGKAVDRRADIWAFGCVLFEMLTGRRVFPGGDVTETIAAIVKSEPEWNLLSGATPAGIQRLLRRCLQKDASRRLHHMADARLELEDALGSDPVTAPLASPTRRRSGWVTALPWAIAGLALVIAASAVFWIGPGGSAHAPVSRLELNLPEGVELFNSARTIALSPDGQRLAFVGVLNGNRRLYLRRLDQIDAEPLRGTDGATTCFFSQDGSSIGFVTTAGQLMTISLADGLVARVTGDASFLYGGAWTPDGSIVFPRASTFWRFDRAGGTPRQVTTLDAAKRESRHAWPTILPDGQTMLFGVQSGDRWRIDSTNLATGARQTVVENGTLPLYVSSGVLIFFRDGRLIAAPFDPDSVKVTGPTRQLLDGLPALAPGIPLLDVSRSGTVVYSPSSAVSQLVWTTRRGEEELLNDEPRIYANPRLSPDGQRIVVQAGDLWMQDLARTTFTRLTSGEILSNGFAIWTPDGRRVIYRSSTGLRMQEVSGSGGDTHLIAGTNEFDYPAAISPDGDTLVMLRVASTDNTTLDILSLSLRDPTRIQSLVATPAYEGGARLSPDGRWMAYVSNESGRNEIYLRPFPGPGERWQVSTEGGTQVVWSPNGRELFYRIDDRMMAVDVTTVPSVTLSPPQQLFETRYVYGAGITIANYDVSRDGQRFIMVKAGSTIARLNVVLNWFSDLDAQAPRP